MIKRKSHNLRKILMLTFIIAVMFLTLFNNITIVKADDWDFTPETPGSADFTMGSINYGTTSGGVGMPLNPHPYLFGEFFCINRSLPLVRTDNGVFTGGDPIVNVKKGISATEPGTYYNQQIDYSLTDSPASEQSLTAAYIAYKIDQEKNLNMGTTLRLVQHVVWSSRQWSGHPGYVENLEYYNPSSSQISYTPGGGDSGSAVYERAEAWANFYYNVLQRSGGRVNIVSEPQDEEDLRVYVDQNARTYTQGGYTIDIVDSGNQIISNNPTEFYGGAATLGELISKEILGVNLGCPLFQFCKLNACTATVTYTDGSSDEFDSFEFLDANGNVIGFPIIGEQFYIRVAIPEGETRTVARIDPHFEIQYLTELNGRAYRYHQSSIEYEFDVDQFINVINSYNNGEFKISFAGTETEGVTTKYIFSFSGQYDEVTNAISNVEGLGTFLENMIESVDVNQSQNGQKYEVTHMPVVEYDADSSGLPFEGDYVYNGQHFGTLSQVFDHIWESMGGTEDTYQAAEDEYNRWLGSLGSGDYTFNIYNFIPIVKESRNSLSDVVQPILHLVVYPGDSTTTPPDYGTDIWLWASSSSATFDLIGKDCTVEIGGKVWVDVGVTKESSLNGRYRDGGADTDDYLYGGMLVTLKLRGYDGQTVASTTTNSDGSYHFDRLNALEDYVVIFTFNGQIYQQTYYFNEYNLSGGYSNAQEVGRDAFNRKFEEIDSYPANYNVNGWHIAYGKDVKLRDSSGNYISFGDDALTYLDAWKQFVSYAESTKSYDSAYNSLRSWLESQRVGTTDVNGVIQFIRDCMIDAVTTTFPVYDQFVIEDIDHPESQPQTETAAGRTWNSLYITSCDQSRNVDFGINERDTADLALQKDVYKATVRINGKTQTYMYDNKNVDEDGNWDIEIRLADQSYSGLYNGETRYTREIRNSEYLYDGTIYDATETQNGEPSDRDLRVYITYRIVVRNQSQTYDTAVNEIVDYFDADEYMFDGTLNESNNTYSNNSYSDFEHSNVTSYIGNRNGDYIAPLTVRTTTSIENGRSDTYIGSDYDSDTTESDGDSTDNSKSPIYLSGIVMPDGNERLTKGGGMAYIYLTFEVKKHTDENEMPNRIQMDVDVSTANGEAKGNGKQNLAEINSYSTYYGQGETVPGTRDNNSVNNVDVTGQVGGLIDRDSTVGNLSSQDLTLDGDLIITNDPTTNRTEDDTDKAPNVRLVFPEDEDERVATGYVYEDVRNVDPADTDQENQENNKSMIGNGRYSDTDQDGNGNSDTKINGVTVQLVELVQQVNADGTPTGEYIGEYVWGARRWNSNTQSWENISSNHNNIEVINPDDPASVNKVRYYSGQGIVEGTEVSPIISGTPGTVTEVSGMAITEDGQYAFKAMPAGDFIIRFIYGDTTQTVLTTDTGEGADVVSLLNGQTPDYEDGYISTSGLNTKSYNGQDYKSTIYQTSIDENGNTAKVSQDGSYNGINGYTNYDLQNYYINTRTEYNQFNPSDGNTLDDDGHGKEVMYYYNTADSERYSAISDAKDVGNVRTNVNEYSQGITGINDVEGQTLVNGRSEVLASGLKVASTDILAENAQTSPEKQIKMIRELMNNTSMTSQTGVIDTTVEHNTSHTDGQSYGNGQNGESDYVLVDIDLGLSERPVAQLLMNKEVSNVRITLQNGTILFDTNRPVTNMSFADHEGHSVTYNPDDGSAYRLISMKIANNRTIMPELITTYMDEELMYGARIEVDYTFTVRNVGEVDYLDNQFYYTGFTNDTSASNISTTAANTVIDYITNNIQFLPTNSSNTTWSIRTVNELTSEPNPLEELANEVVGDNTDLINNKYYETLNTYNTIVTNKSLGINLYPEQAEVVADDEVADPRSSAQTTMMLSTTLVPDSGEDTMVYNNLCEIVQVSNSQGRRLKWSVTGNQPMANQDLGSDTPVDEDDEIYTKVDLVTPKEIDADSSQEILILPPTGANRNYTLWIIVGVVALAIIAGGVILIRRYFKKK